MFLVSLTLKRGSLLSSSVESAMPPRKWTAQKRMPAAAAKPSSRTSPKTGNLTAGAAAIASGGGIGRSNEQAIGTERGLGAVSIKQAREDAEVISDRT